MANFFLPQIITWFRLDEHVKRLKEFVDSLTTRVETLENAPSGGGGAQNLQAVTTAGNTTNQPLVVNNQITVTGPGIFQNGSGANTPIRSSWIDNGTFSELRADGSIRLQNASAGVNIEPSLISDNRVIQVPDSNGTLVLDAPSDSQNYVRNNATWVVAESGPSVEKGFANFELYSPFTTATGTGNDLLQMLFPILLNTNYNIGSNFDQNTGRYTNNGSEPIRVLMQISLVTATSTFSLGLSNMLNVNFQSSVGAIQATGVKPINGTQTLVVNGSAIFYLLPGEYVTTSVQYKAGASININKIDVTITEL